MNVAAVYADGGCIRANPSPIGGVWAWCATDARSWRVHEASGVVLAATHGRPVTNNAMEFLALLLALEWLPDGWSGRVCSDSGITLGRFCREWQLTGLPADWIARGAAALQRLGTLDPVQLDGHPTRAQLQAGIGKRGHAVSSHNVHVDRLCTAAARAVSA